MKLTEASQMGKGKRAEREILEIGRRAVREHCAQSVPWMAAEIIAGKCDDWRPMRIALQGSDIGIKAVLSNAGHAALEADKRGT